MELSLILVLTLVTLVTATPHGYGVKGGASARAEASAVAGGFGDLGPIPLSIPSGAAYSGSFSKSSSSSFASSSASSSSSSYSFSGSGVNGITDQNGSGHKGCNSGACPGTGANNPSLNGGQQFGSANAVAAAQAKALSGASGISGNNDDTTNNKDCSSGTCPGVGVTNPSLNGVEQSGAASAAAATQAKTSPGSYQPCHGNNCNGSPSQKCLSGQCSSNPESIAENGCSTGNCQLETGPKTPSSQNESSKDCSSGQCDENSGSDSDDSNDFAVNINRNSQSKLSQDSVGHYSNKNKPYSSGADCANGNCGPNNHYPSNTGNNQYRPPAPATYLTTPNHNAPCTTESCSYPAQGPAGPETAKLPSSYNVPIQSATNPPNSYSPSGADQHGIPCTSPNCNSAPNNIGTSNVPKYNYGHDSNHQKPCVSGKCDISSSSNVKPYENGYDLKSPSYSHGTYPLKEPSSHLGGPGCSTPNCAEPSSNQPHLSSTQPEYPIPTYSNLPSKGPDSSCGNAGCGGSPHSSLQSKPTKSDAPVYTGGFGGPAGGFDTAYNKLAGHSVNHYGSTQTPGAGSFGPTSVGGSFGTTKPNVFDSTNQYTPSHTPSISDTTAFGSKPTHGYFGTTKPNDVSPAHHYNPTSYTPNTSGVSGSTPAHGSFGATKPNELNSNNLHGTTHTSNIGSATGDFGINKPNGIPSKPSTQYNTNFGAPTGLSSGYNTHHDHSGVYKPSLIGHSGSSPAYTGGNEGSTSLSQTGSNSIHGSFGITKPSISAALPTSQSSPSYTGGFGGPIGPIDGSSTFGSPGSHKPGTLNCGLADCSGQQSPNINAGTTPHDNIKPSIANAPEQKKPTYSGGFGGPTGFLKPHDFGAPASTGSSAGNTPCTNGNCGPKDTPSSSYGLGNSLAGAQSVAAASASANAVAYSGGFGGPPGVLKPFDDGKSHSPAQGNLGTGQSPTSEAVHPDTSSTGGKNSLPGNIASGANAVAHASASASATAGSYGGNNNHQHNGASGGCNSGCSSNGSIGGGENFGFPDGISKNGAVAGSLASAKSIAGANAFGLGGSFASSSASAHASVGAPTKGGYGKK